MMATRGGKCSIWRFCVTAQDKLLADKIPVTPGDEDWPILRGGWLDRAYSRLYSMWPTPDMLSRGVVKEGLSVTPPRCWKD
jgi:hypothetical protein